MFDGFFEEILRRIRSAEQELNFSNKDFKTIIINNRPFSNFNLSSLTFAQSEQFKQAIINISDRIRKIDLSRNVLTNLGDLHVKRTTSGGIHPTDEETTGIIRNVFEAIMECRNLEELILSECDLEWFCLAQGEIPKIVGTTIRSLPKLRILDISGNSQQTHRREFTNALYEAIGESNIEELNLAACTLGKWRMSYNYNDCKSNEIKALISTIFGAIGKMKKLKILTLTHNDFINNNNSEWELIATSLLEIKTLKEVDVRHNGFNNFLTPEAIPAGINSFVRKLWFKGLKHDLVCLKLLERFREQIAKQNIERALDLAATAQPDHPDFIEIRFEAFQSLYFNLIEEYSPQKAFIQAMSYCFYEDRLLGFSEQQLMVFDSILLKYFGKVLGVGQQLSEHLRNEYLQKIRLDAKTFKICIEQYEGINEFTPIILDKVNSTNEENAFLIYLRDIKRWYFIGQDHSALMTIGFVDNIISLNNLNVRLQSRVYEEVRSDNALVGLVSIALGFSQKCVQDDDSKELLKEDYKQAITENQLEEYTVCFFKSRTSTSKWKAYPTNKIPKDYQASKVSYFTLPKEEAEVAKSFFTYLKGSGFDVELRETLETGKPSIIAKFR